MVRPAVPFSHGRSGAVIDMHGTPIRCEALPDELPGLQRWLVHAWQQSGLPAAQRPAFELALEELFINIATHGRAAGARVPQVVCSLDSTGAAIELCVQDDGPAFDPLTAAGPDAGLPLEARTLGGVGIALVRYLMDEVTYRRVNGQNELRCLRHHAGPVGASAGG